MLVFTLKRIDPITEYTRAHPSSYLPSADLAVRSHDGRVRYPVPHRFPARFFFYTFRLAIVLEGISSNWTRQEAAHRRGVVASPV